MWRLAVVVVVAACGRVGFDARTQGSPDGSGASDAAPDGTMLHEITSELVAPNADANDLFGNAIAISRDGSTIAIAAPGEASSNPMDETDNTAAGAGAVYVFTRPAGTWQLEAYLKNRFGIASQNTFGASLAISQDGNVLAIGETKGDVAAPDAGDVVMFTRTGTQWTQAQILNAAAPDTNDLFGFSVGLSVDGSTLVVGAPNESSGATLINGNQLDNSVPANGAAYVFTRSGSSWALQAYLKPPTAVMTGGFGWNVRCSDDGNVVAASAPSRGNDIGEINVFMRSSTVWSVDQTLPEPVQTNGDFFGYDLALSGDGTRLVAGAPGNDTPISNGGVSFVFLHGSTWTLEATLSASNAGDTDQLGDCVAMSGDGATILVGASLEDSGSQDPNDNSAMDAGAAYRFTRTGTTWTQTAYLKRATPTVGDNFGFPVEMSRDASVTGIGAASSGSNSGRVLVTYFGQ